MKYVLWKQYGFIHICRDEASTLCGNEFGWLKRFGRVLFSDSVEKLNRPLCGNCKRLDKGEAE